LQAQRAELIVVLERPGLTAERDGRPLGLVTYRRETGECDPNAVRLTTEFVNPTR